MYGTSGKAQAEMRETLDDRLILLEDSRDLLQAMKDDLDGYLGEPSSDGVRIQTSGKLYKRLLKKRVFRANYHTEKR